jgi:hypothetical protein
VIKLNQKNVLALRVYDRKGFGGIWEGPLGIVTASEYKRLDLNDINTYRRNKNRFTSFPKEWNSLGKIIGDLFDELFN